MIINVIKISIFIYICIMLLYFCFCKQINNNMAKRYGCFPKYVMGPSYKCRVPTELLSLRDICSTESVVSAGLLSLRDMCFVGGCRVCRAVVPAGHGCVGMGWGVARMVGKPRRG